MPDQNMDNIDNQQEIIISGEWKGFTAEQRDRIIIGERLAAEHPAEISRHGTPFERVAHCNSFQMSFKDFRKRTDEAIRTLLKEIDMVETPELQLTFDIERSPYNGTKLWTDEEIIGPNATQQEAQGADKETVLQTIWQEGRHSRWVNLYLVNAEEDAAHFQVIYSACFGNSLESEHPNPLYPFQIGFGPDFKKLDNP